MKRDYVLVCDSHASIPEKFIKEYDIKLIPSPIIINDQVYHDTVDITDLEVYEQMRAGVQPKTSMPEFGSILNTLEALAKEYQHVIYVVMSSGFSGTYQSALLAKEELANENITILDSKKICFPHGLLMIALAHRLDKGLSVNQIPDEVKKLENQVNELFMLDDLFHLKRLGRLGHAEALLGSTLKIKPLFTFNDGVIDVVKKIRTHHKALDYMIEQFSNSEIDPDMPVFLATTNDIEIISPLLNHINITYPDIEVIHMNVNPVITAHSGLGVISIGWLNK